MSETYHSNSADGAATLVPLTEWNFPQKTCEPFRTQGWILQPYSFSLNVLAASIMLTMAFVRPGISWKTQIAIAALSNFEIIHALSHMFHLDDHSDLQMNVIHVAGYLLASGIFLCFNNRYSMSRAQLWIVPSFVIDLAVFLTVGKIYQVLTGFGLMITVVLSYYPRLEPFMKRRVGFLSLGAAFIGFQIALEAACCEIWASWNPNVPYHVAIEAVGLVMFVHLADTLCVLEAGCSLDTKDGVRHRSHDGCHQKAKVL